MGGLIVSYIESDTHKFFIIKASIRLVNLSKVQGCISVRGGHVGLSTAQQTTAHQHNANFSSENILYLITEARNKEEFNFFYIEYKKAVTSFLETLFACRGSLYHDLCWLYQYGTAACCAMTGRCQYP